MIKFAKYVLIRLALFLAFFALTKGSWAGTINAASCSFADVSAAANAAITGDTIIVPAGTCTWGSNLLDLPRGMNIIGAGAGKTVIVSTGQNIQYHPNSTAASNNESVRISGFTFNCSANSLISLYSQNSTVMMTNNRIDHNVFNSCGQTIMYSGNIVGLIDSNSFIDAAYWGLSIRVDGRNWYSWDRFPLQLGTAMSVYVEDNTWRWTVAAIQACTLMDCDQAGRYVFRYNKVDLTNVTGGCYPFLDAHGNQAEVHYTACPNCATEEASCCTAYGRGTLGVEVYDNTITTNIPINLLDLRGGTGIVFNNVINDLGFHPADWFTWRMREEDGCIRFNWVPTYPAYDQVRDTHFWNNKASGIDNVVYVDDDTWSPNCAGKTNNGAFFIQKDRDYFLANPVGKIINGSVYIPYAYPHPLRNEADVIPPAAPTELTVR